MEKEYTREVHIELGGETRRVLLNLWGLVLAEEKGFDVADLEVDADSAEEVSGKATKMLDYLWVGMLPFNEDLTRKELGMEIGMGELPKIQEAFDKIRSRQLTQDVKEKIEEAASEDGDGGKSEQDS